MNSRDDELEFYKTRCAALERELEIRKKAEKDIRAVRHDIKNHLAAIAFLIKKKEYDRLEKYVSDLDTELSGQMVFSYTGISALDSVITVKKEKLNIKVHSPLIKAEIDVSDCLLCAIFSNVIEIGAANSDELMITITQGVGILAVKISWFGPSNEVYGELREYAEFSAEKAGIIISDDVYDGRCELSVLIPANF